MAHIKDLIEKNNFKFKKNYGQNFLIDQNILHNIVASADIDKDSLVIEIGVGAGALTSKLASVAGYVIGYEIDHNLKSIINETLNDFSNIDLIYDDFLKRNIQSDINKYRYSKLYVVANLPYYITTPIITKIIDEQLSVDKMIIMVQKEVGERLKAKPNSKDYNSLTIFINYYFDVKKLFNVSKNVFIPRPNVDSVVVELSKRKEQYKVLDEKIFFKLVRDAFKYKRKNLRNNLKGYDLQVIENVLAKDNLDLTARAEQLTIDQFIQIANEIKLYL